MKKILQRYDWGEQPATAHCSYVLVENPLGEDDPSKWAVYTWNRDVNGMTGGHYFRADEYNAALVKMTELVAAYEKSYGAHYPGKWVNL